MTDLVLTGEHLTIHIVPGRTDALIAALKQDLNELLQPGEDPASVRLRLVTDGQVTEAEWSCDESRPDLSDAIAALADAADVELVLQMCCERARVFELQSRLTAPMAKGALMDCARLVSLVETRLVSSLSVCGLYRGTFIDDAIPFTSSDADVLHVTGWNDSTHRAVFTLKPDAIDTAADIADELNDALDIDLTLDESAGSLRIDSVHLEDYAQLSLYTDALNRLNAISASAELTGALSPDRDDVFGLVRFVLQGTRVVLQSASA